MSRNTGRRGSFTFLLLFVTFLACNFKTSFASEGWHRITIETNFIRDAHLFGGVYTGNVATVHYLHPRDVTRYVERRERIGHGSFEFLFANESATYNGDFHNDKMHGKGTLKFSNGTMIATGEFADGKLKEGFQSIRQDNVIYTGFVFDFKPHGEGFKYYTNGTGIAMGEFVQGKLVRGKGVIDYGNRTYLGGIDEFKPHGYGELRYTNGTLIKKGEFVDGELKKGQAHVTFSNQVYVGDILDYKFHGQGLLRYTNGTKIFEGYFHNGHPRSRKRRKRTAPNKKQTRITKFLKRSNQKRRLRKHADV